MLWLCFAGFGGAVTWALYSLGYLNWNEIMRLDNTGTTIFILFVFAIGFVFSLSNIIWLEKLTSLEYPALVKQAAQIELDFETRGAKMAYVLWLLPILGFVGTLIGVMIMSYALGSKISLEKDPIKIVLAIQQAIGGISTAAFTSVVGMITAAFLALLHTICRLWYLKLIVNKIGSASHENT